MAVTNLQHVGLAVPDIQIGLDFYGDAGLETYARDGMSFPPKTGPLFLETEGGCDGSETLFG